MYQKIISPLLFCFDPETIHKLIFKSLHIVCKVPGVKLLLRKMFVVHDSQLETVVAGLHFPNPVGLAAGFDKDAKLFNELACFGFGFIEIGTVTPVPQPGNPRPRMFRLKKDLAIINRMGFNNQGAEEAAKRLKRGESALIVGGNIGKNKVTPNDEAVQDYKKCFEILYPYVNYFVINVSSPNTPGLRGLQEKEPLLILLSTLVSMNNMTGRPKPIFLKIAPDLKDAELDDIVDIVLSTKIAGVIATNTTIDRSNLVTDTSEVESIGMGGLSGQPLTKRSTEIVRYLHNKSRGLFAIIAVGGIMTPDDALEKLRAGASLVQVYTGFIYKGPGLVKEINKAILKERRLS